MAKFLNLGLALALLAGAVTWLTQPVAQGEPLTYTVQATDTLDAVALRFNTTEEELIRLNGDQYPKLRETNGRIIVAGWVLTVRPGGAGPRWESLWPSLRDQLVAWLDVAIQAQKGGGQASTGTGGAGGGTTQPQSTAPATDAGGGYFDYDAALQIVELTNAERAQAGLPPLAVDENLMEIARKRAVEITMDFSHSGLGALCPDCGENINRAAPSDAVRLLFAGWMGSAGHRANILREDITRIGVGVYIRPGDLAYASQVFAY